MDSEAQFQFESLATEATQPLLNSVVQQPTPPPPSSALVEQPEEKPIVPQVEGQEQEPPTPIKTGTPDIQETKANVTPSVPEPPKQKLTETELLRERLKSDPLDTSAHQRLIGIAEASGDVEKIQDAYEGLLAAFPNATSAQIAYLNHFLTPALFLTRPNCYSLVSCATRFLPNYGSFILPTSAVLTLLRLIRKRVRS
ncbi:hypothetical protein RSOLAG22IIIB_03402 [Rhizoctonia solani]|uniref:Uncharacterized protein n=1 Tax=Rhizoctonia solani TaxID=456999 RepID=A0A0K6FPP6_9AGAM|nr:hypothetical protein RSOLAG22IIIB_03402 [Rhizoctonia solani]